VPVSPGRDGWKCRPVEVGRATAQGERRKTDRREIIAAAGWLALGAAPCIAALAAPARSAAAPAARLDQALLDATLASARGLPSLHSLIVARDGDELVAERFRGSALDRPVNVKSVSKAVIAALVGGAIARGVLKSVEQPVAPVLDGLVPADADPRVGTITLDHLLSMRAGLERTSGRNYGRWVSSADWVGFALSRPFVDEPGGRMLYSTGNYHLLSAALTRASGRSTLALARDWLGDPLGIEIPPWTRDPQGFYLGGNNMLLSPRALLRLGELHRQGGAWRGGQVLPRDWVEASWTPRTSSFFTGHAYGYGWFIVRARGYPVAYAWGYGGQLIYVVPSLGLTAVITSEPTSPSGRTGHVRQLHGLLADGIIPAAERA
jgi:CubicO group peptidase (beta-lactamase class C family)